MKTLQITNVRFIPVNAKVPFPLFIIDLANGQEPIIRSESEFLTDLRNSYLIGTNVRNANHPELLSVLRDLQNATVTGEITYAKKGELWTVTENSRVIKDTNHPKNGKVGVGDKLPYEKDMSLVTDGFLTVVLSPHITMMNKQAQHYGMALASMLNTFEATPIENTSTAGEPIVASDAEPVNDSQLDPDVLNEAMESVADDKGKETKETTPKK